MTELTRLEERALGLAGIVQAAALVQQLARRGETDSTAEQATVNSILAMSAADTPSVFGGIGGVELGLRVMRDTLIGARSAADIEVLRYVVSLTYLQKSLYKNKKHYNMLVEGMQKLLETSSDVLHGACAELYMRAISPLKPRIYVQGEHGYLQQDGVADRVRTLLLGGIRASVLWQQKGGSRLEVMLNRRRYRKHAARLLPHTAPPESEP